ncbi:hypothetical protein AgCh_032710 [Apium graveolens]
MKAQKPIYYSETAYGLPPEFVTSVTFNGRHYIGAKGRSRKESQQLAARAVILSILGDDRRIGSLSVRVLPSTEEEKMQRFRALEL